MNDLLIRLFSSFSCGVLLSISGSLCQLVTFNPMSSPSTLGMQGFAVIFFLVFHFVSMAIALPLPLETLTILSSIFLAILFLIKRPNGKMTFKNREIFNGEKIVLIGICFNLLIGALFSLLQFLTMTLNLDFPSSMWFGHFRYTALPSLVGVLILMLISFNFILKNSRTLRFMNLGPDFCTSLGLDTKRFIRISLALSLISTSVIVSYFGVFAFLGLIFPHLLRTLKIFKQDIFLELTLGALLSGMVLMVFDWACYHWTFFSAEVPVGMVSGLFGSAYLVFFFLKKSLKEARA